jgi:hypothetical protein
MRRTLAPFLVLVGIVTFESGAPLAAPKTADPGVTVTFGDRHSGDVTDAIFSDGHGPYVNGVGGVVARILVSGSGDMTLNLSKTRPNRVFNGVYIPATDVSQPIANPPSGTFTDGSFLSIGKIWSMGVGETKSTGASFNSQMSGGSFRWCAPGPYCDAVTELVTVTRTATDTWTVSADPATSQTLGTDLDALIEDVHWQALGSYHMPFSLTIQCSNSKCQ